MNEPEQVTDHGSETSQAIGFDLETAYEVLVGAQMRHIDKKLKRTKEVKGESTNLQKIPA